MNDETDRSALRERISNDPFCATTGVTLAGMEEGSAKTVLTVGPEHLNFHETVHGGAIYTLADAAFAAASNSRGETALALETNVSYLSAVEKGETLRARADETYNGSRTAEYDVVVSDDAGSRIATFRGRVYKPDR